MKHLILLAALLPAPALAAELWCMPETICSNGDADCQSTADEEASIRFADMQADTTNLRSHAEDIAMTRKDAGDTVEWAGTNKMGAAEFVIWTRADNAFTYLVTATDGKLRKAVGYCEVQ